MSPPIRVRVRVRVRVRARGNAGQCPHLVKIRARDRDHHAALGRTGPALAKADGGLCGRAAGGAARRFR